jgi:hypothetical protein
VELEGRCFPSSNVEVPFFRTAGMVGERDEARPLHEKIDAFQAAALLLFVELRAALPPVALLVCSRNAALVRWRRGGVELGLRDDLAQGAVNRLHHVLERDIGAVGRVHVELPWEAGDRDGHERERGRRGGLLPRAARDRLVVS